MLSIIDDIELSVLAETGSVDLAERTGIAVRTAYNYSLDMLAMICGLGDDFSAQYHLALG